MTSTTQVYRALHGAVERATGLTSNSSGTDIIRHQSAAHRWAWFDEESGRVAVSRRNTDDLVSDALDARMPHGALLTEEEWKSFVHALDAVVHAEVLALYHDSEDEPSPADASYQSGSFTVANGAALAAASLIRGKVFQDPEIARLWPDLDQTPRVPYLSDAESVMAGICGIMARESGTTVLAELTRLLTHQGAKLPYLVRRLAEVFCVPIVPGEDAPLQLEAIEQAVLRAIGTIEAAVRIPGGPATADGSLGRAEAVRLESAIRAVVSLTTPLPESGNVMWMGEPLNAAPSSVSEAPSIAGAPPHLVELLDRARKAVEELFGATVHVRTYQTESTISPLRNRLRGNVVLGRYRYGSGNGGELILDVKRTTRPIRSFLRKVRNTPVTGVLSIRDSEAAAYREALATVLHEHIHALGPDEPFAMHAAMNRAIHGGRVLDEGLTELATSVFMVDFLRTLGIAQLHGQFQTERTAGNYPAEVAFASEIVGYLAERYGEDPRAILRQLVTVGSEHGPLRRMAYLAAYGRGLDTGAARDVAAGIILRHARKVEHAVSHKQDLGYRKLAELGMSMGKACVGEVEKTLRTLTERNAVSQPSHDSHTGELGAA